MKKYFHKIKRCLKRHLAKIKFLKAFTITELIVVIAIVGILSSVVFVNVRGMVEKARLVAIQSFIRSMHGALGAYVIGWWPFDGNTEDISGYGNNGTITGTTNWSADSPFKTGQVLDIKEGAGYIDIDNIPVNTSAGGKTTVMFWMKWTSPGNAFMPFAFYPDGLAWGNGWWYGIFLDCHSIGFNTGGGSWVAGVPFDYDQVNIWHHIAAVFYNGDIDATNNVLYIDGVRQTISACPNPSADPRPSCCSTFPLAGTYKGIKGKARIGASPSFVVGQAWNPFKGFIDDVRIYNSATGLSEVQKVYAEGLLKHLLAEK